MTSKSYDSFEADRVGGRKSTETNMKYDILKDDCSERK